MGEGVFDLQPLDAAFHRCRQRVVCGARVGKLGFSAAGRHHAGGQQRVEPGGALEAVVCVPDQVGPLLEAADVVGRQNLPVAPDIGDVAQRVASQAAFHVAAVDRDRLVQPSEPFAECQQVVIVDRLLMREDCSSSISRTIAALPSSLSRTARLIRHLP